MDRPSNLKKTTLSSQSTAEKKSDQTFGKNDTYSTHRPKVSSISSPKFDPNTDLTYSLESKERRLDEQFKTLLERCNKSKAFIENIHKANLTDRLDITTQRSSTSILKSSPSLRSYSPHVANNTTLTKPSRDYATYESRTTKYPPPSSDVSLSQTQDSVNYGRLENDIVDLKKNILDRIKSEEKQKLHKIVQETSSSSSDEENRDLPKQISLRQASEKKSIGKTTSTARLHTTPDYVSEKRAIEKNLDSLKTALKEKERITEDRFEDLKGKNQELKEILREYINKCIDYEEITNKKDTLLSQFEERSKADKAEIERLNQTIEDLRKREDLLLKNEEDLREQNMNFREKLDYLEQAVDENDVNYRSHLDKVLAENNELKTKVSVLKERESLLKERYESLNSEVSAMRSEVNLKDNNLYKLTDLGEKKENEIKALREQLDHFMNENKGLTMRLEEKTKNVEDLERKVQKHKQKNEDEKNKIIEEKEKELIAKKEKIKHLKFKVDDFEAVANKAMEERKLKTAEVERLLVQKAGLERDVGKYKEDLLQANNQITALKTTVETLQNHNDELMKEIHGHDERTNNLHTENRKQDKIIKGLEERIRTKESEVEKLQEINDKLKTEVRDLLQETTKSREYILKLETQHQYLQTRQSEELTQVEKKIEELSSEMGRLKEENMALRVKESHFTKDNETLREERDTYKKEYKSLKQVNRALERDLQELNAKLKDVLNDRKIEAQIEKENNSNRQTQTKIKVLDEIQDMIRHHRVSHKSAKNDLSDFY